MNYNKNNIMNNDNNNNNNKAFNSEESYFGVSSMAEFQRRTQKQTQNQDPNFNLLSKLDSPPPSYTSLPNINENMNNNNNNNNDDQILNFPDIPNNRIGDNTDDSIEHNSTVNTVSYEELEKRFEMLKRK
ncbi:hypothetical protein BCR36DRAFT_374492 [Piromyces finnis]|uniref:Uncharacterized protein n=1 Tax=Piromyces finnis TaxID=1754191 RepID=A0A1Y1UWF2_9FUNG|nr:hypothetical protein BCR36DRAFT_374492 [Piromyces finnis]|eukprot:ORX42475.1 hypothetical protein BCR36DRAFT_374492 [Piromyces finnis]